MVNSRHGDQNPTLVFTENKKKLVVDGQVLDWCLQLWGYKSRVNLVNAVISGTWTDRRISPSGQLRALPKKIVIASTACQRDHIPKQAPKEHWSLSDIVIYRELGISPYLPLNSSFACCLQYILMFPNILDYIPIALHHSYFMLLVSPIFMGNTPSTPSSMASTWSFIPLSQWLRTLM